MKRHCKYVRQVILPNLRNIRGFAILLYSYLVVWFVVMFTTTLLTMSTLDLSHAQRAIATQQAFWAAEGELEASIADLKVDTTVFALSVDMCLQYGARTLKSDGSITSSSSLCGTSVANNYRLEVTGTAGSTTQTLSTIIQFAGAGETQFAHVAYADGIRAEGADTGSINSETELASATGRLRLAALMATSSWVHDHGGNLATRRSARAMEQVWDRLRGRYLPSVNPPIEILDGSTIHGNVFLGRQWDHDLTDADEPIAFVAGSVNPSDIQSLPEEIPWPMIEIPQGATQLGIVKLQAPSAGHPERELQKILYEGAYEVERLILADGAELCTIGTVDLYVTGRVAGGSDPEAEERAQEIREEAEARAQAELLREQEDSEERAQELRERGEAMAQAILARGADGDDDDEPKEVKISLAQGARLYGQPVGSPAYARYYSPADLRIFVKGQGLVKIGARGSLTAALIYAPEAMVGAKAGTFLGAITAKRVELRPDGSYKTKLIYDDSLEGKTIPIGTSTDVNIKVWTQGGLLSEPPILEPAQ